MRSVLDLQIELWRKLAVANRRFVTGGKPELQAALQDFDRSFPQTFSVADEEDVLFAARRAPFVLVGDFHTLPAAQVQTARWLRLLRPRVLGLEIFCSEDQEQIDSWAARAKPAAELLRSTNFAERWPMVPSRGYEELLECGRELGCRILGCEHPEQFRGGEPGLDARDVHMGAFLQENAKGKTLLLVGDVHLRPNALPARLPGSVVVHQNVARFHFEMSRLGTEPPGYLRVGPGRFCWQGVHPLLVEESCLRAMAKDEDAFLPQPEEWFSELAERVAKLLDVDLPPVPTLLTTHDEGQRDLLATIATTKQEAERLVHTLRIRGSHAVSEHTIVLHQTGTNHVSEALGRWLMASTLPPAPKGASRLLQLVAETRDEAAGFLCSVLVNPLRRPKALRFYRETLRIPARYRGLAVLARQLEEALALGTVLGTEDWPDPKSSEAMLIARVAGHALGAQLRSVWLQSPASRSEILALLRTEITGPEDLPRLHERMQLALD